MLQLAQTYDISTLAKHVSAQLFSTGFVKTKTQSSANGPQKKDTDLALVKRFQEGDLKVFDLLVIKYQRQIARVVSKHISDHDAVKDVTQEIFISAYKGLNNFRLDSQFYTWLYRIAVNSSYSFFKSNKKYQYHLDIDDLSNEPDEVELRQAVNPEQTEQNEDLRIAINHAVTSLPIDLRTVLLLREKECLSYEQIANIVTCQVGTVKSRISRARAQVVKATKHLYYQ